MVGHLGPDLLGPAGTRPRRCAGCCAQPGRAIGEALLDQRNLAGIGNVYKCRGAVPARASTRGARSVKSPDLDDLIELARRLLDANKERFGQITTGVWRRGEETWVYGRAGRPCRRCGTPVRSADQGADPSERITYWCPRCQS